MRNKQREIFRKALLEQKKELEEDILFREGVRDNGGDFRFPQNAIHMAEVAGLDYQNFTHMSVREQCQELLKEIDRALKRIEDGTYGRCENCHGVIPTARLEAKPFARFCIDCREISEQI